MADDIHTPPDRRIDFNGGSCSLRWVGNFAVARNAMLHRKQKVVDSEVLSICFGSEPSSDTGWFYDLPYPQSLSGMCLIWQTLFQWDGEDELGE